MSAINLTDEERGFLQTDGNGALAMAMRIVVDAAEMLGAIQLVPVSSAHIDGCLYHGDSGVEFAERLVQLGGKTAVPATLNVGALDLLHPEIVKGDAHFRAMARRLMDAHIALGCQATWTCAPYQAGNRPALGAHVAWGESNAIAFVNSVLGARTNRYGDFLDICCALTARAPFYGLHIGENRAARIIVNTSGISDQLKQQDVLYPVLGAWLGKAVGDKVSVITGLPKDMAEDSLKALGAGSAATGAVGLFHVEGVTPEAPDLDAATQGLDPECEIDLTLEMIIAARDNLSSKTGTEIDCLALGSPHFSFDECQKLLSLANGKQFIVPVYVCTHRLVLEQLKHHGLDGELGQLGVQFIVDTCVVVTPILDHIDDGVMMTNSAKFAHYGPGNTGYHTVFGALSECVRSAQSGKIQRDPAIWQ